MKTGLYLRLAKLNIKNNKKIYYPYLLTGICMVMIFYIINFLAFDKQIKAIPGGGNLQQMLGLGIYIIAIFSAIFLFYTSSFVIKRRKKEFGLYNILGMGKRHIARVMLWETFITSVTSVGVGLILGIIFSKLAQLFMIRMLDYTGDFTIAVDYKQLILCACLYFAIYFLILLNSLRQVHTANPIQLLHGSTVGEKAPKANWVLAVIGVLTLGTGYFIALRVTNAVSALSLFFVAVIFVIIGTYICFIAASVAILKLLRKKKNYYYKTKNFISVSGMTYRMKRNGAGLASICILSTIVLVMLSSVTCLYIGCEDAMRNIFPREIVVNIYSSSDNDIQTVNGMCSDIFEETGETPKNTLTYNYLLFTSEINGDKLEFDKSMQETYIGDPVSVLIVTLDEYNTATGQNRSLNKDEVLVKTERVPFHSDNLQIGSKSFNVVDDNAEMMKNGNVAVSIMGIMFVVVPDSETYLDIYNNELLPIDEGNEMLHYFYGFDVDGDDDHQIDLYKQFNESFRNITLDSDARIQVSCFADERFSFYTLYAGLFFLGIILGITFVVAAVLIMYYKQVTEGYEDQSRFEIMQKVGMTKKEIKSSINSQILTVFFMPLITAGIHISFAFPMIQKLLTLFSLYDTKLFLIVTAVSFVIFAAFYTLVYAITSKAYYKIVSEKED